MTERQEMWLEIGEAFGTPRLNRVGTQGVIAATGLCNALKELDRKGGHEFQYGAAKLFAPIITFSISGYEWYSAGGFWFECFSEEEDAIRSVFACMMAAISDEDYKEMVNSGPQ